MNKNRTAYYALGLIIAAILAWFYASWRSTNVTIEEPADKTDLIRVRRPLAGEEIQSPLVVRGEARGTWFFEASFPVRLLDGEGKEIAVAPAQAEGEWMTEKFVPFKAELTFKAPESAVGTLVLQKDNPSGLPEYDDEIRIPVRFATREKASAGDSSPPADQTMAVKVFFNNSKLDPEFSCNKVFPVTRMVPKTTAVARAALQELLKGPTREEMFLGFITSINPGVKIQKLSIQEGTAKTDFNETLDRPGGGSCRVSAIRAQITETLKQFNEIQEVVISINGETELILQP